MHFDSIMIIDDNEDDRYLLKRQFKKLELVDIFYEMSDGTAAIEELTHWPSEKTFPDLIFLDINMPTMNGFEFLDQFFSIRKNRKEMHGIKILMLTSSQRREEKEKALTYDFVKGYIAKMPITAKELREKLEENLF